MKTTKISLAQIRGKLSKEEMKKIMAGSGGADNCNGVLVCDQTMGCGAFNCTCSKNNVCVP
jgi:hypothetical protein